MVKIVDTLIMVVTVLVDQVEWVQLTDYWHHLEYLRVVEVQEVIVPQVIPLELQVEWEELLFIINKFIVEFLNFI